MAQIVKAVEPLHDRIAVVVHRWLHIDHPLAAQASISDPDGIVYSCINMAWSGDQSSHFAGRAQDWLEAGLPLDAMVIPAWSPNDIPGVNPTTSTITAARIAAMKQHLIDALMLCQRYNVLPIVWTGLSTNTSVKIHGASDSLRRDYNAWVRTLASKGVVVVDADALLAGVADGDGQVQYVVADPTDTSDGIHPNDHGHDLLAPLFANGVIALGLARTGQLVTARC